LTQALSQDTNHWHIGISILKSHTNDANLLLPHYEHVVELGSKLRPRSDWQHVANTQISWVEL